MNLLEAIEMAKNEYRRLLINTSLSNDEALELECNAAKIRLNELLIEAKQEGLKAKGVEIVGFSKR